jgi:hypothetical protein
MPNSSVVTCMKTSWAVNRFAYVIIPIKVLLVLRDQNGLWTVITATYTAINMY